MWKLRSTSTCGSSFRFRLLLLLVLMSQSNAAINVCADNDYFGEKDPKDENSEDDITDTGFLMLDASMDIDCCGVAEKWEIEIKYRTAGDTIYFQIWRPTTGGYELVGQTSYVPCCADGAHTTTIPQADRYTVKSGDVVGCRDPAIIKYDHNNSQFCPTAWSKYTPALDLVRYRDGGGGRRDNNMLYTGIGISSIGDVFDWSASATTQNNRDYGIRFDVNANTAPTFDNLPDDTTIPSSTGSGVSLVTFTASDIDTSDGPAGFTWDWVSNSQFSFDTATQVLYTGTLSAAPSVQEIVITAADQCENTVTSTYTVTITNVAPTLTGLPAAVTVSEDETAQTLLYTITCTDPTDTVTSDFTAATKAFSYPFAVQQIPSTTAYGVYNSASPAFDYDTKSAYALYVECSDGYSTDSGLVNVYLIENAAPIITNLQDATSISISSSIGFSVFNITTTDAEGDTLTYSFTCDNNPCPFDVMDSGQVVLNTDLTGTTIVGYDIYVTVSDGRNTVGPSILTVTISDINSPVTITNLPLASSQAVSEDTTAGTSLYTVSYNDIDTSQTHVFSMTSGGSGMDYFEIDVATGIVSLKSDLDYEALDAAGETSFPLSITVSDGATSDTQTLTFHVTNVNDAPSFSQASYSISANESSAGTVIGSPSYSVIDPDTGDTKLYTGECGAYTSYFFFAPSDGSVSYQSDYDLDLTSPPPTTHACTVTVTDSAGATATASLTITIANINDNTPLFTPGAYSMFVSYYASASTTLETVTATDGDAGTFGDFTYSLDQSTLSASYFTIDSNGNIVTLLSPSGIGNAATATITAVATDTGGLSGTAAITIIVSDTTTSTTTTTTDSFLDLMDDSRNVFWLVACIVALVGCAGVITWIVYTCRGPNGWSSFCRLW